MFDDERRGAEIDYLKRFGSLWLESGGHQDVTKDNTSRGFMLEHPRYKELIKSKIL